ncbi:MAG: hypothetical protein JO336_10165 [Acidobacteriia bacterium]|nr:hypothetical protein [Terriglobia bacterium]MBV8904261.1 hypothetical protein [Terriglobia bacterium]
MSETYPSANLVTYTWNGYSYNESSPLTVGLGICYPPGIQYDAMGRLSSLQEGTCADSSTHTIVTGSYGPADQLTNLSFPANGVIKPNSAVTEQRSYNTLLQLTRQTISGGMSMDLEYTFSSGNQQRADRINHRPY